MSECNCRAKDGGSNHEAECPVAYVGKQVVYEDRQTPEEKQALRDWHKEVMEQEGEPKGRSDIYRSVYCQVFSIIVSKDDTTIEGAAKFAHTAAEAADDYWPETFDWVTKGKVVTKDDFLKAIDHYLVTYRDYRSAYYADNLRRTLSAKFGISADLMEVTIWVKKRVLQVTVKTDEEPFTFECSWGKR